jgi:hypothetical protein
MISSFDATFFGGVVSTFAADGAAADGGVPVVVGCG